MPKVEISNRGLIQTTGNGLQIDLPVTLNSSGLSGVAYSAETTLARTGAGTMGAITVDIPPGAVITDVGMVVTTAITSTGSMTITAKVGTAAAGAQICAAANLVSADAGGVALGRGISASGANAEGAAALAFVAEAAMRATAARSIHFTIANDGNNTTGDCVCYVAYAVV